MAIEPTQSASQPERDRPNSRAMWFAGFVLALLGLIFLSYLLTGRFIGIDDAHIFFGYAENICRGNGITYGNNGVRVEGCTSMLWLLVCTLNFYLGLDELGILLCCIAMVIAAQWLWVKMLDQLANESAASSMGRFAYCAMVLSSFGYITWTATTCMDLALWGLLLAWMTSIFLRAMKTGSFRRADIIPFLLAPWCRPEATFICPACLGLLLGFRLLRRKSPRQIIVLSSAFVVSLSAITVFRLSYFGYPFPNTYYAKVSPSILYNIKTGMVYAGKFLQSGIVTYLLLACFLAKGIKFLSMLAKPARWKYAAPLDFLWLWGMALFLPPILTGGDHFVLSRFFQAQYPLFCILVLSALLRYAKPIGQAAGKLILCAELPIFITFSWSYNSSWISAFTGGSYITTEFALAKEGMESGRGFSGLFHDIDKKPAIGVICAGGISRTYSGNIIDLMGLNNLTVAHFPGERKGLKNHAAFETGVFEKLNVDIMPFPPDENANKLLKGLCTNETFAASWRYGTLRRKDNADARQLAMISRQCLESLLSTSKFEFSDELAWNGKAWIAATPILPTSEM